MSIDTVSGGTAAPQSASATARAKLATDYDSFLTLLTAQVANQDPLEPMDSSAFVSQLAQLTQVEQAITANANLEEISARLGMSSALSEVGLLGREVTVPSDRIELIGGKADYAYELQDKAASVKGVIRYSDGTVVRELLALPTEPGRRQSMSWDGKDREGLPVPDGSFTVELVALDAGGAPVAATGYAATKVSEVLFQGGEARLALRNGGEVAAASVIAVR